MAQKKASTTKKPAAHSKKVSSKNSGSNQTMSLHKHSEKLLKSQREKPAGDRRQQRMEVLLEKRTAGLKKATELLRKEKSERRLAEKKAEHLSSFPQLYPSPVMEVNIVGEVVFCNKAAIRTLKELNQGEDARLFLPSDMDKILKSLKSEERDPALPGGKDKGPDI